MLHDHSSMGILLPIPDTNPKSGSSVKASPLAMELAGRFGHQDRRSIRERIASHSELDVLLAETTEADRKHMTDYLNLQDAIDMLDAATMQLDPGPLKETVTTLVDHISTLDPEFPDEFENLFGQ
jgi:hypothetical protein